MNLTQEMTHNPVFIITVVAQLGPENINFSSYVSVNNDRAMCGFTSINEMCDNCIGVGGGGGGLQWEI
jgi:hypothetical protein